MKTTVNVSDTVKNRKSTKTSKKASTAEAMLKAALDAAQVEYPPLSQLVKSPKNVRTLPYTKESVRELADSLLKAGLLQNLIVHRMPDGLLGVAAGGRRMTALQLLAEEGHIHADYPVAVKVVDDELAVVASIIENEQRRAMHPAEQIIGFRTLASEGKRRSKSGICSAIPHATSSADYVWLRSPLNCWTDWQRTNSPLSSVRRWRWKPTRSGR